MFKKVFFLLIFGILVFAPFSSILAETSSVPPPTTISLENPLGAGPERLDIRLILGGIIAKVMGIAGALILLVFLYGGFMWLTAAGNPEHVKKGTQAMLWAVVGLFIIFASYGMLSMVFKAMGTAGSGYNPWGVEGYTKSDVEKATEACYCKETTATGATTPTQVLQPTISLEECKVFSNTSGSKNGIGSILSDCEWKKFQSTPETK